MSNIQQLDTELKEYLEKEPNLRREDRLSYLRAIMGKHLEMSKLEHVVNNYDLFSIISGAKTAYSRLNLPIKITKKQVDSSDVPSVAMVESVISYMNKNNLLKKLVKFDYTG